MPDFKWLSCEDDFSPCLEVRKKVFCLEQGISEQTEFDSLDKESFHLLLSENGEAVGTGRIIKTDDKTVHFGHIAILENYRKNGFGKILIDEMVKKANKLSTIEKYEFDNGIESITKKEVSLLKRGRR